MPWSAELARHMIVAEKAGLVTEEEYDSIRNLLMKDVPLNTMQATDAESINIPTANGKSGFVFGKSSLKELEGVKTELVLLARRALELSTQDFCVYDGLRTVKEQERHVKNGTSKTMNSKHLKGLAVDLVPWVNGKPTWDWDRIYPIAAAVDEAAREMGIEHKIRWGGAWDRTLADFHGDPAAYKRVVEEYGARQLAMGKFKVFIDGPHFEWVD